MHYRTSSGRTIRYQLIKTRFKQSSAVECLVKSCCCTEMLHCIDRAYKYRRQSMISDNRFYVPISEPRLIWSWCNGRSIQMEADCNYNHLEHEAGSYSGFQTISSRSYAFVDPHPAALSSLCCSWLREFTLQTEYHGRIYRYNCHVCKTRHKALPAFPFFHLNVEFQKFAAFLYLYLEMLVDKDQVSSLIWPHITDHHYSLQVLQWSIVDVTIHP